jgi:deoxyribonucleoside regulator
LNLSASELLARVASLYYESRLTQSEIGKRIGASRSTVSRLLDEARESGIVEIVVHYPWKENSELEQELTARFSLSQARVLAGSDRPYSEALRGLGVLAARYIEEVLHEDAVLGISWGTSVYSTVQALRPNRRLPITVVQMIGAAQADDLLTDGPDLARLLADAYDGTYQHLHAPLVVESAQMRDMLLQEPRIRGTLDLARRADIALVGIGTLDPKLSSWLRAGCLDREALSRLRDQGAVGDICGWHYDVHGCVLEFEVNRRVVGITLEGLQEVGEVIAVAGGKPKVEAILGALRGEYVDVLVTDAATAQGVLIAS